MTPKMSFQSFCYTQYRLLGHWVRPIRASYGKKYFLFEAIFYAHAVVLQNTEIDEYPQSSNYFFINFTLLNDGFGQDAKATKIYDAMISQKNIFHSV